MLVVQRRGNLVGLEGELSRRQPALRVRHRGRAAPRPLNQVQAITGYHSLPILLGYMEAGEALSNPEASLLDDDEPNSED